MLLRKNRKNDKSGYISDAVRPKNTTLWGSKRLDELYRFGPLLIFRKPSRFREKNFFRKFRKLKNSPRSNRSFPNGQKITGSSPRAPLSIPVLAFAKRHPVRAPKIQNEKNLLFILRRPRRGRYNIGETVTYQVEDALSNPVLGFFVNPVLFFSVDFTSELEALPFAAEENGLRHVEPRPSDCTSSKFRCLSSGNVGL